MRERHLPMSRVSIIIPTLNEVNYLERTLRQLVVLNPSPWEVIIVDGQSEDETIAIAQRYAQFHLKIAHRSCSAVSPSVEQGNPSDIPALATGEFKIVTGPGRGRSIQQNYGADLATGDILCFLHADTWVPDDLIAVVTQTLNDPKVVAGGFIALMVGAKGSTLTRWGISLHNFLKTYYAPLLFRPHLFIKGLRLLFGDQVIFCRKHDFVQCGGFNTQLPIMEEADLCLKLIRFGAIRQVNRVVQSSDRRVAHWGIWKATAIYLTIALLWGFGISARRLKQLYQDVRL